MGIIFVIAAAAWGGYWTAEEGMNLAAKSQRALVSGLFVLVAMILFPPWTSKFHGQGGYHFILGPEENIREAVVFNSLSGSSYSINFPLLLLQIFVLVAVVGVIYYVLKQQEDEKKG